MKAAPSPQFAMMFRGINVSILGFDPDHATVGTRLAYAHLYGRGRGRGLE